MITIVGTGHVFDLSSKIVQLIEEKNPDVICIELDEKRYRSLISGSGATRKVSLFYEILAYMQKRLAEWQGVRVGEEMLIAIKISKEREIPLELIDMDVEEVFRKFWKSMSFREKMKLLISIFMNLLKGKHRINKELENIENRVDELMKDVEKVFPSVKKILVDERNRYMVKKLEELVSKYDRILVIVGDGHVAGMEKLLKEKGIDVEVIRLKDLKEGAHFSFTVDYGPVA